MDISRVKLLAGITGEDQDELLEVLVPILVDYASQYCRREFDPADLSGGVELFVARATSFYLSADTQAGMQSEKIGDYSYTLSAASQAGDSLPGDIVGLLKPYRKVQAI